MALKVRDQALDRGERVIARRVEQRRTVIAFDDGDRAAGHEELAQLLERRERVPKVFEHETDEDVVEGVRRERQREEVRLHEADRTHADPSYRRLRLRE